MFEQYITTKKFELYWKIDLVEHQLKIHQHTLSQQLKDMANMISKLKTIGQEHELIDEP